MQRSMIFWTLMLLWLVLCIWNVWPQGGRINYAFAGGNLVSFILFGLLGWQVYGPAIKG